MSSNSRTCVATEGATQRTTFIAEIRPPSYATQHSKTHRNAQKASLRQHMLRLMWTPATGRVKKTPSPGPHSVCGLCACVRAYTRARVCAAHARVRFCVCVRAYAMVRACVPARAQICALACARGHATHARSRIPEHARAGERVARHATQRLDVLDLLQRRCNAGQRAATRCNVLQRAATCCNAVQRAAMCCNAVQRAATCCNAVQRAATCCNALQRAATRCNALQRAATQRNAPPTMHSLRLCAAPASAPAAATRCRRALQCGIGMLQHDTTRRNRLRRRMKCCDAVQQC
jgi:hypothetical protein